jgi:alcohol dehydrogenase class IV
MDALTHAIEAFIGNTRTKETKRMSMEATKLIVSSIKTCYHEPSNAEARKNMLFASHYAGISFTKAYVGYVHAIAHTLGGKYGVPHGLANSVILPVVLDAYGEKIYKKLAVLSRYSGLASDADSDEIASKNFINWIKEANKEMNIPSFIEEIKEGDIDFMIDTALKEGNPLYPVPVLMGKEEIKQIYLKIMKSK